MPTEELSILSLAEAATSSLANLAKGIFADEVLTDLKAEKSRGNTKTKKKKSKKKQKKKDPTDVDLIAQLASNTTQVPSRNPKDLRSQT